MSWKNFLKDLENLCRPCIGRQSISLFFIPLPMPSLFESDNYQVYSSVYVRPLLHDRKTKLLQTLHYNQN